MRADQSCLKNNEDGIESFGLPSNRLFCLESQVIAGCSAPRRSWPTQCGWASGAVMPARRSCTYTRGVASFANRLACLAIACVLSGTQTVLAACMALCLVNPMTVTDDVGSTPMHHEGRHAATQPVVVSPHAHHAAAPSTEPGGSPDSRLVGSCDDCCGDGLTGLAVGPGEKRTDAQADGVALAIEAVSLRVNVATPGVAPPSPPTPPPSPATTPLVLRI